MTCPTVSQQRLDALVAAAEELAASGIPLLPVKAKGKAPIPHPESGSWWVLDDPDTVAAVFTQIFATLGDANLAILCGRAKTSPVLVVDVDGPTGLARARELGVTSAADCWVQRTGGGGVHVVYFAEAGLELHRHIKPEGFDLDLIVDGYALVPPSITKAPYSWLRGHGPSDIPLADLAPPPAALLEWWRGVGEAPPADGTAERTSGKAWRLVSGPIPDGCRHDSLVRIAGWLHLYHPPPVVEALLLAVNDSRCQPPMEPGEVLGIARSVSRYPQTGVNGHPRAAVPRYTRAEHSDV